MRRKNPAGNPCSSLSATDRASHKAVSRPLPAVTFPSVSPASSAPRPSATGRGPLVVGPRRDDDAQLLLDACDLGFVGAGHVHGEGYVRADPSVLVMWPGASWERAVHIGDEVGWLAGEHADVATCDGHAGRTDLVAGEVAHDAVRVGDAADGAAVAVAPRDRARLSVGAVEPLRASDGVEGFWVVGRSRSRERGSPLAHGRAPRA